MKKLFFISTLMCLLMLIQCKKKGTATPEQPASTTGNPAGLSDINNTYGFSVLNKLVGIWDGPVNSTTALGSYPQWIVDFRPISSNQISAKNELDTLNDIHMSFFIAKYNNEYRIAFRNGGTFNGNTRVSYFLCDSVYENLSHSYYRFSEVKKGKSKAYTNVIFKNDSLILKSYTNIYNTLTAPTLHMAWFAKNQDVSSASSAVSLFSFPQKTISKDFTNSFANVTEAVYYNTSLEPYQESSQPYLGKTTISYSFDVSHVPVSNKRVMVVCATQPLLNGVTYNSANLKYISRYVTLTSNDLSYTFNYMHPGSYYLYAFYDNDNNGIINSGDWISANNFAFSLSALGNSNASTQINFTIP